VYYLERVLQWLAVLRFTVNIGISMVLLYSRSSAKDHSLQSASRWLCIGYPGGQRSQRDHPLRYHGSCRRDELSGSQGELSCCWALCEIG
jgi:hypothetical protein